MLVLRVVRIHKLHKLEKVSHVWEPLTLSLGVKRGPVIAALKKAVEMSGTKVYVYNTDTFVFVSIFNSIRSTSTAMPISYGTLVSKLDAGKSFKRYYYYTSLQIK